jgi:hypothetical protein
MKKGVVPEEKSAEDSGSVSGSPRLAVNKAIDCITSAHKHLTKAFEDGSEKDLDRAGEKLIEAKKNVTKALKDGDTVDAMTMKSLEKAGKYYMKALETYEKEDAEGHIKSVNKAIKHMSKAIAGTPEIKKSVDATELHFVRKDGKVVLEMTEAQYADVHKSLSKDNLYKSLENTISEETKKTIDAVPMIKSLFADLAKSNDSLRDAILDKSDKEKEFKKSVGEAIDVIGTNLKKVTDEIESLKSKPNARKSVVSVVESPLAKSTDAGEEFDAARIDASLERGLAKGLIDVKTVLAWDIDRSTPESYAGYAEICKSIEARIK